ncbi:MAG: hypothetical protein ACTSR2_15065 [Candidatus Hodarchaeales archaeon]
MTGVALKRSRFFSRKAFFKAIEFALKYHKYVFIDYEGIGNQLTPSQIKFLLEKTNNNIVVTIATRAKEFRSSGTFHFDNYLELFKYQNFKLNVVAGHPSCSTVNTRISKEGSLEDFVYKIGEHTNSVIFLGTEGIRTKFIENLRNLVKSSNSLIPFVLNGDYRLREKVFYPPLAVYSPLTHIISEEEAMKHVLSYLLRRKETIQEFLGHGLNPALVSTKWDKIGQGYKKVILEMYKRFILGSGNFQEQISMFRRSGVGLIVGNPMITDIYQDLVKSFALGVAMAVNNYKTLIV